MGSGFGVAHVFEVLQGVFRDFRVQGGQGLALQG